MPSWHRNCVIRQPSALRKKKPQKLQQKQKHRLRLKQKHRLPKKAARLLPRKHRQKKHLLKAKENNKGVCIPLFKTMQKNDTYIARCTGYTEDGAGGVRIDGFVIFVKGLMINEEAEIGITALKKNHGYGRIVRLTDPSPDRIEPQCSVFRPCGGCQLQHMNDSAQRFFKEEKVRNCFRANAGMEPEILPIIRTEPYYHYRNKVQVPVQFNKGEVEMGFYQNHTNRIINYDTCNVQSELSDRITVFLKEQFRKYGCAANIRHVLIKHAHVSNQVMIALIVRKHPFDHEKELTEKTVRKFPEVRSMIAIENRREDNVILDGREYVLYGDAYIEEELLDCRFRISARSFFQINPYATRLLYAKALEYAGLSGRETVIDLYCGTGTIGILASKHAKKVYGIEIVADAVKDAKVNARINDADNIAFLNMDASNGAQAVLRSKIKADAVIVDPPRKGCSKDTLDAIIRIAPKRLVYVSCDPSTLARDVRILCDSGFSLEKVQPVDMFPQTVHVETVCCLYHQKKDFISVPYEPKNVE